MAAAAKKFSGIAKFIQELPALGPEVDLSAVLHDLHSTFAPYSRPPGSTSKQADSVDAVKRDHVSSGVSSSGQGQGHHASLGVRAPLDSVTCKPVTADRIKWKYSPSFDPRPFLRDPRAKATFEDPNLLRLPRSLWPSVPRAKVHGSKQDVLKLASLWDKVGALRIFRLDEINDPKECAGLFCVGKDCDWDRLILNPVVANSRVSGLNQYTRSLGHGSQLCSLHIPSGSVARFCADDLAEFYYTIAVTEARAKRNAVSMAFDAKDLSHLRAFDGARHWGACVIALACLAMGDCHAVELAQQSHFEVLRTMAGCLLPTEVVTFRRPFPRSDFLEFLCIDDHVSVQILNRAAARRNEPARDTSVFSQSHAAYDSVGLHPHPKKCRRNLQQATLLGADIDGEAGFVSAPRDRTLLLMLCTAEIAKRGACTPKLLNVLVGCWIHVLMYRRPALCVLDQCFKEAAQLPADVVVRLSQRTRNELLTVATLGPVLQTNLRTEWCPEVFCMDASPWGAGLCSAPLPECAIAELHRHTEQRGFYTKLEAPASAALRELGLETEPTYFEPEAPTVIPELPLPRSLTEGILFDCCELCHEPGSWAQTHASFGLSVTLGWESVSSVSGFLRFGVDADFRDLLGLALRRVVRDWHAGPPPLSFCRHWQPPLRTKRKPAGTDLADPTTAAHNKLGFRLGFLLSVIATSGHFYSVEQPSSSFLFELSCFKRLLEFGGRVARFCYCSFGCKCDKSSLWLHNKPWLLDLPQGCSCISSEQHFAAQGVFDEARIAEFESLCSPSSASVFGRAPRVGENVCSYLARYPALLVGHDASGSLTARAGRCKVFPLSERWGFKRVFREVTIVGRLASSPRCARAAPPTTIRNGSVT